MTRLTVVAALLLAAPAGAQFSYTDPGDLERPGGGSLRNDAGRVDSTVYAPGMRFPIETAPAYANSQIYGHGGYMGPGGGECDAENFAYPWHDNYCEERSWTMPLCPSGRGHQGQDIRPATCRDNHYWVVATEAGTVTNIGSYSVYVTADDGTRFDYLHMHEGSVAVTRGQRVSKGQRLGRVSDNMGSTSTTVHLHFNIKQNYGSLGFVYVPTYMSLVRSYEELVGPPDWRAEFVSQSFPYARDPFVLAPGEEAPGYIEMRNTGGATWRPGEVFLGTTQPRDGASPIAGSDWVSERRAATVDAVTAPGEVGRFSFSVRAPDAAGDYPQFFNLVREGVAWFGVPGDDQLQVKVTTDTSRCAAGTESWSCEGMARVRCSGGTIEREACEHGCESGSCLDASGPVDADGDGHNTSVDCDDTDPSVFPGAEDGCGDGIDSDCDGIDRVCGGEGPLPGVDGGGLPGGVDGGSATSPSATGYAEISGGCSTGGEGGRGFAIVGLLLLLLGWRRLGLSR